jgi:hypothetical protein
MTKMLKSEKGLQHLDPKELLITYLYALALEGKESLSEGELAEIVYNAQEILPFRYKFLKKAVNYSYDLLNDVEKLRDSSHLEAAVKIVGTESVPKFVYSLTFLGRLRAKDSFDALPDEDKKKIKMAVNYVRTLVLK